MFNGLNFICDFTNSRVTTFGNACMAVSQILDAPGRMGVAKYGRVLASLTTSRRLPAAVSQRTCMLARPAQPLDRVLNKHNDAVHCRQNNI